MVEWAILEALDSLGTRPGRGYRVGARVLAAVEDRIGETASTPAVHVP